MSCCWSSILTGLGRTRVKRRPTCPEVDQESGPPKRVQQTSYKIPVSLIWVGAMLAVGRSLAGGGREPGRRWERAGGQSVPIIHSNTGNPTGPLGSYPPITCSDLFNCAAVK